MSLSFKKEENFNSSLSGDVNVSGVFSLLVLAKVLKEGLRSRVEDLRNRRGHLKREKAEREG